MREAEPRGATEGSSSGDWRERGMVFSKGSGIWARWAAAGVVRQMGRTASEVLPIGSVTGS